MSMLKHPALVAALVLAAAIVQAGPARAQLFLGKNAADWEQALRNGKDARARRNAVFALGKLGNSGAPAVASLKKCLREDKDASVREAAAFALGEIGRQALSIRDDPDIVDVLAKSLKDANPLVRRSAAYALGNLAKDAKPAQAALEAALADGEAIVRQNVAWALGRVGPGTVPSLRKALQDKDNLVRRDAADSLGHLNAEILRNAPPDMPTPELPGKAALPELLACCQDPTTSELRFAALRVLIKLVEPGDKKSAAAILPALKDDDMEVRQNAALALANIGGPDAAPALPVLLDALDKGDPDFKQQAAAAIANLGPDAVAAVPALIKLLSDPSADLRRNVVLGLGGIGPKAESALPAVAKLVTDPKEDKNVRMEAAVTMNRFGPGPAARKTVPDLLRVLEDPADDGDVRWRITWALRVYKDDLTEIPGVLPAFVKVLSEKPRRQTKMLRYDCAYLLGMLLGEKTPKEALDVLLEFLKDESIVLYDRTAVQTSETGTETNVGKAKVKELGKGDGRMMAVTALIEVGPAVLMTRPDIVRQLRAIGDNPDTVPELKKKTKTLLAKLVK
jgi:HEAT repeat protein